MKNSDEILDEVLTILNGRSGFDDWWYNIDEETQNDIIEECIEAISKLI